MAKRAKRPDGASSIYFGKDGYWHGRVTVGVCDDGNPDRRHVMSKVSEAEVIRRSGRTPTPATRWPFEFT